MYSSKTHTRWYWIAIVGIALNILMLNLAIASKETDGAWLQCLCIVAFSISAFSHNKLGNTCKPDKHCGRHTEADFDKIDPPKQP